jgi:hypothetical protein
MLLAGPRGLSRDELATFLSEACSIVNQTPLHETSDDPNDPAPITPQMLLTLREPVASTDLEGFSDDDLLAYGKSRWRRTQYLVDQFWKRWRQDYLLEAKRRHKWTKSRPCATIGDLVLISDKNTPRNHWPTGKITTVNKSQDGLVRSVQVRLPTIGKNPRIVTRAITDLILLAPSASHSC